MTSYLAKNRIANGKLLEGGNEDNTHLLLLCFCIRLLEFDSESFELLDAHTFTVRSITKLIWNCRVGSIYYSLSVFTFILGFMIRSHCTL